MSKELKDILKEYSLVLGLEVHMQPKTENKMFCGCSADIWKKEPNSNTCPVCLGLPGALPVPNFEAVEKTQLLGAALGCNLNNESKFDRKHYFYPDLPKGYQISQYKQPLVSEGELKLDSGNVVKIERIHLEEDAAKSFHEKDETLIDFNKGGMPLMELVTFPCFNNVEDAVEFTKKLQQLLRHLNISEADMEKGQMRLEPNISIRTKQDEKDNILPDYKVEVKNINSFRFMEKVINYEIKRQYDLLSQGKKVQQENRGYNEKTGKTYSQRSKEEAHDYRYFPEPDIPLMTFENEYLEGIINSLPELPMQTINRLQNEYGISHEKSKTLVDSYGYDMVYKFEAIVKQKIEADKVINLLLNKKEYQDLSVQEFVVKFKKDNEQITDTNELQGIVEKVIESNEKAVNDYKNGKEESIKFLLGMVMRETKGKANHAVVLELLQNSIK